MAASNAIVGPGFQLQISDASMTNYTAIAEVQDISGPGMKTKMVSVSHQLSPSRFEEKRPSMIDAGDITFDISYVPTDSTHTGLLALQLSQAVRNWKITNPANAVVWSGRGYVSTFSTKWPKEDRLTAALTLSIDGPIAAA
jgi:hypothetical protein